MPGNLSEPTSPAGPESVSLEALRWPFVIPAPGWYVEYSSQEHPPTRKGLVGFLIDDTGHGVALVADQDGRVSPYEPKPRFSVRHDGRPSVICEYD